MIAYNEMSLFSIIIANTVHSNTWCTHHLSNLSGKRNRQNHPIPWTQMSRCILSFQVGLLWHLRMALRRLRLLQRLPGPLRPVPCIPAIPPAPGVELRPKICSKCPVCSQWNCVNVTSFKDSYQSSNMFKLLERPLLELQVQRKANTEVGLFWNNSFWVSTLPCSLHKLLLLSSRWRCSHCQGWWLIPAATAQG